MTISLVLAVGAVVVLNLYAALLIWLRSVVYGVPVYRPMLLNICLSFAPVLLAAIAVGGLLLLLPLFEYADRWPDWLPSTLLWAYLAGGVLVWLLFFPNSIYLITELNLSHRAEESPVPLWYDIVQTLALTLSGIANAVLSLAVVQSFVVLILQDTTPSEAWQSWVFAGCVILLGAVGVYLGRYLRFNSWDVKHPVSLVRKLVAHLRQRGKALEAGGFILTHTVLIGIVYVPLYAMAVNLLFTM